LGITDNPSYAKVLADKFDYTNTYYDREPRLDVTQPHQDLWGTYNFVSCADVLEHIEPPVEAAVQEVCRLLKPNGFLVATVPCIAGNVSEQVQEHFPDLNRYRVVRLGDSFVLINRRHDGTLEVRDDLLFHEGIGSVLEMRQFGVTSLRSTLLSAGFRDVFMLADNLPAMGIMFDCDVSQPFVARKEPFTLSPLLLRELVQDWRTANGQLRHERERTRLTSQSRWLRLGRLLGLGPGPD